MTKSKMTGVIVHAVNPIVRAGLESIIRTDPALSLVGSSSDLANLMGLLSEGRSDVVLLEWQRDDSDRFWEQLLSGETKSSDSAIIVLADRSDSDGAIEALSIGVQALLPRSATAEEIVVAIAAVASGLVVLHPDFAEFLLSGDRSLVRPFPVTPIEALSPREIEVLEMLALGLGNKAIASRLNISEHTVKFHLSSIFTKLNASSRTEAVTVGIRQGLIML